MPKKQKHSEDRSIKKEINKSSECPYSVNTSGAFALLLPKDVKCINTLQKRPSTFNKHCKISPHLGNRFKIDETKYRN